jgi:hypothetical protein
MGIEGIASEIEMVSSSLKNYDYFYDEDLSISLSDMTPVIYHLICCALSLEMRLNMSWQGYLRDSRMIIDLLRRFPDRWIGRETYLFLMMDIKLICMSCQHVKATQKPVM